MICKGKQLPKTCLLSISKFRLSFKYIVFFYRSLFPHHILRLKQQSLKPIITLDNLIKHQESGDDEITMSMKTKLKQSLAHSHHPTDIFILFNTDQDQIKKHFSQRTMYNFVFTEKIIESPIVPVDEVLMEMNVSLEEEEQKLYFGFEISSFVYNFVDIIQFFLNIFFCLIAA